MVSYKVHILRVLVDLLVLVQYVRVQIFNGSQLSKKNKRDQRKESRLALTVEIKERFVVVHSRNNSELVVLRAVWTLVV